MATLRVFAAVRSSLVSNHVIEDHSGHWHCGDLTDAIILGLQQRIDLDRESQVVRGIDALDEVSLHPLLEDSLRKAGYGVFREQRYPHARTRKSKSEGRRCDLVLTHHKRPLQDPAASATLFEDPQAVPLQKAFWLEVKTVSQFTESGPNASWTSELLGTVRHDISKLANDQEIAHAGLLILLWVEDARIATHDFAVWQDRCLAKNLPIGAPSERQVSIQDRLGHPTGVLRLYPVHHM